MFDSVSAEQRFRHEYSVNRLDRYSIVPTGSDGKITIADIELAADAVTDEPLRLFDSQQTRKAFVVCKRLFKINIRDIDPTGPDGKITVGDIDNAVNVKHRCSTAIIIPEETVYAEDVSTSSSALDDADQDAAQLCQQTFILLAILVVLGGSLIIPTIYL